MLKNSKSTSSECDTHNEQGHFLTATQSKKCSVNVIKEIGNADNYLKQVNGGGASHVPASSDPFAIPYGLHLH